MTKELRTYLEWRFRVNTINKYKKYQDEWINNIPQEQLWYFEIEMKHLKDNGKYI